MHKNSTSFECSLKAKNERYIQFELQSDINIPLHFKNATDGKLRAIVEWQDPRKITLDQRGYIYGLFNDFAEWTGYDPLYSKELLKALYCVYRGWENFSLANNAITQYEAGLFIEWLIDYFFSEQIPFRHQQFYIDSEHTRVLFLYLKYRRCFVCGAEKSDVHHATNRIGMGRNRKNHDHSSSRYMCLCRKHHNEAHTMTLSEFMKKYKLVPIKLSAEQVRDFNIR